MEDLITKQLRKRLASCEAALGKSYASTTFEKYQQFCKTHYFTPLNHHTERLYLALALCSEAGEVGAEIKGGSYCDDTHARNLRTAEELGDCLYFIAMLAERIGIPLEAIAMKNIEKVTEKARAIRAGQDDA